MMAEPGRVVDGYSFVAGPVVLAGQVVDSALVVEP
jgi:hypothetical protein